MEVGAKPLWKRKLPKKHKFPGGFVVEIYQVERGETVKDITLGLDCDGYFDTLENGNGGVILLWKGLTPLQKWRTLSHEMLHAAVDADHFVHLELDD